MDKTESFSTSNRLLRISLILTALTGLGFLCFSVWRFFNTTFIFDDYAVLKLGLLMKQDPFSFFTFTYFGWFRPLAFGMLGLLFQLFSLNSLPYHVFTFIVHLLTAISIFYFCKKLFNKNTALLSFSFYVSSPVAMAMVGQISSYCDELATMFIVLSMMTALRTSEPENKKSNLYWKSAILLFFAAGAKETWIATLPAMLYIDFINYKTEKLNRRIIRLLPFVFPFLLLLCKFIITSSSPMTLSDSHYMHLNLFLSFVESMSIPFIPFFSTFSFAPLQWLKLVVPICAFIIAILIAGVQKKQIILLCLTFIPLVLILTPSPVFNSLIGWIHLPPLVAVSSCLIGFLVLRLIEINRLGMIKAFLPLILFLAFTIGQHWTRLDLFTTISEESRNQIIRQRSFQEITHTLVAGSHIYYVGSLEPIIAQAYWSPAGIQLTRIAIREQAKDSIDQEDLLSGDYQYISSVMKNRIAGDLNYVFIVNKQGSFINITEELRDILSQPGGDAEVLAYINSMR